MQMLLPLTECATFRAYKIAYVRTQFAQRTWRRIIDMHRCRPQRNIQFPLNRYSNRPDTSRYKCINIVFSATSSYGDREKKNGNYFFFFFSVSISLSIYYGFMGKLFKWIITSNLLMYTVFNGLFVDITLCWAVLLLLVCAGDLFNKFRLLFRP